MQKRELKEVVELKNSLIDKQTKRISLLEEKLEEVRHKYFRLKYGNENVEKHLQLIRKY